MDPQAPDAKPAATTGNEEHPLPGDRSSELIELADPEEIYSLADVIERHREVTDKISTQVRTISVGMLVFVWSMLNAVPGSRIAEAAKNLIGGIGLVALFAVLALLIDYLQYVLAKWVVDTTRSTRAFRNSGKYKWPTRSIVYRAQFWCFWGKQVCCIVGVLFVSVVVFIGFFS